LSPGNVQVPNVDLADVRLADFRGTWPCI